MRGTVTKRLRGIEAHRYRRRPGARCPPLPGARWPGGPVARWPGTARSVDAGRVAGVALGPLHVVVAAGHDPLGEQTAARLQVGHQVPAAIGVGGEVTDGVEELDAVLGRRLRA